MEKEVKNIHELRFVTGKGWGVKRQGSDKVIKYFKTKLEGTEYLLKVSENTGTSVVICLKNGQYQRFDSAKMALSYAQSCKDDD